MKRLLVFSSVVLFPKYFFFPDLRPRYARRVAESPKHALPQHRRVKISVSKSQSHPSFRRPQEKRSRWADPQFKCRGEDESATSSAKKEALALQSRYYSSRANGHAHCSGQVHRAPVSRQPSALVSRLEAQAKVPSSSGPAYHACAFRCGARSEAKTTIRWCWPQAASTMLLVGCGRMW